MVHHLPFLDLRGYRPAWLTSDLTAALAVTFLSIPQGVAYALIAGLPPAVGLYAATVPALIGGLMRSSRYVVSGPTNALSLLVGGAVGTLSAQLGASPVEVAVSLALAVGLFQLSAGVLRLGALVDYISAPVVLGYISGAGVLIAAGQLHHLTGTEGGHGPLWSRLAVWVQSLGHTDPLAVSLGLGTIAILLILRRINPHIPGSILVMVSGIAASWALDLRGRGLQVVADLSPIPASLPPLTLPRLDHLELIAPVAFAATVLSLVESTAVARALAARSGERLDSSMEFVGQGLANLSAAFVGGYPVSGSPSRSSLNLSAGSMSRLSGALSGVFVLALVALAGPVVDLTPVASLAGLLMLVAWDLIDRPRIAQVLRARWGDRLAFLATLLGTWALPLDRAIYLGVVISLVMFLRRARLLIVRDLVVDETGRMREVLQRSGPRRRLCSAIRVLHLEGAAFFGAAGELRDALDAATEDRNVRVLLVRTKRLQGMDLTAAQVFGEVAQSLRDQGRALVMVGMRRETMRILRTSGVDKVVGEENLFPTRPAWFAALELALKRALELAGDHDDGGPCPYSAYVEDRIRRREERRKAVNAP
ncbi:MAG: SulP family inorganic anion transporter [Alphaproteobacteria bacterium]|nr:SulP family inorganic anion transporter [Alphaproteobacteria bacterium]